MATPTVTVPADIERVETTVTLGKWRPSIRSAAMIALGALATFGLGSLLIETFKSPTMISLAILPLAIAMATAFYKGKDGRHLEQVVWDRVRYSMSSNVLVLGGNTQLRPTVFRLWEERLPVSGVAIDTTTDENGRAWHSTSLKGLDLPASVSCPVDNLRLTLDDVVVSITFIASQRMLKIEVWPHPGARVISSFSSSGYQTEFPAGPYLFEVTRKRGRKPGLYVLISVPKEV